MIIDGHNANPQPSIHLQSGQKRYLQGREVPLCFSKIGSDPGGGGARGSTTPPKIGSTVFFKSNFLSECLKIRLR